MNAAATVDRRRVGRTRRTVTVLAVGLMAGAGIGACSSGADDGVVRDDAVGPATDAVVTSPVADASSDDVFSEAPANPSSDAGSDELGPVPAPLPTGVVDAPVETITPVPDTGVPGIDSDDDFCRAWSEFAGTYQALTFSWAVVGGSASARLETVANDALRSAAATLASALPAELEVERQELTVELTTPILRRADRARALLAEAGVDDDANAALGERWLTTLADAGIENEAIVVVVDDPTVDAAVDEAAETLLDELPPIIEDPSLIVQVEIPATTQYLFDNCPDRGVFAGNDNVEL